MHATVIQPSGLHGDIEVTRCLQIVMVAEDWETGQHAARIYERLQLHLGKEFDFEPRPWDFKSLAQPRLRNYAAHEAATADIIIFAVQGTHDLPGEVKQWVKLWLGRNADAPALVLLFGGTPATARQEITDYLTKVARQGGMELFVEPGGDSAIQRQSFHEQALETELVAAG